MDFTSENWEQLGQGQGDLFWDTALDNYWNLFLLNPPGPNLTFHPDGGEKLEALVKESPESTDTAREGQGQLGSHSFSVVRQHIINQQFSILISSA
ncbi:hypothetical protein E5288_WYG017634 [Bos mutus]|uniref:KRAB domain-containing protein n=1 Tax=Bos mutus TaxID=72004 RepID=A0A6B0RW69_9CETA|nr:hypothetical protein [Bos mutus]